MSDTNLSRVQEKGQVTIPAKIRKRLGLKKGDLVAFVETEEGVMISPQEMIVMDSKSLGELDQILKEKGLTLEEFIAASRRTQDK